MSGGCQVDVRWMSGGCQVDVSGCQVDVSGHIVCFVLGLGICWDADRWIPQIEMNCEYWNMLYILYIFFLLLYIYTHILNMISFVCTVFYFPHGSISAEYCGICDLCQHPTAGPNCHIIHMIHIPTLGLWIDFLSTEMHRQIDRMIGLAKIPERARMARVKSTSTPDERGQSGFARGLVSPSGLPLTVLLI
jgi:hypothetical protein